MTAAQTNRTPQVGALFQYSGLAVVGASPRNVMALHTMEGLRSIGYTGQCAGINPNAESVAGYPAYKSLSDVPFPVEHAFIAIRADRIPDVMRECAAAGVRGVTIVADGFAEAGAAGQALQAEIVAIARGAGIAVCGPNCMGVFSIHDRTATYARAQLPTTPGGISVVSASGGLLSSILAYGGYRGMRFSKMVSAGNEAVCQFADYVEYLVDDPTTTVIGLLLESVRSPQRLRDAFARALEGNKPIVALKMGTSTLGARAAATHTAAIVGAANLFAALAAQYGVTVVEDIDELCESMLLFAQAAPVFRRRREPRGVAVIEVSGGGAELVCDVAERASVTLLPFSEKIVAELEPVLPNHPANPIDMTGAWQFPQTLVRHTAALKAITADGAYDIVIARVSVPQTGEMAPIMNDHAKLLTDAARENPETLFGVMNWTSEPINPNWRALTVDAGLASLLGYKRGMEAVSRLLTYVRLRALPPGSPPAAVRPALPARVGLLDEVASKDLLAEIGVPVNRTVFAASADEAVAAATAIGFPIAIKGISPAASHKSDFGLVQLGLKTADEVAQAARRMLEAMRGLAAQSGQRTGLSVQASVQPGLETIVGAYRDDVYGPVIVCGVGGFFAEAFEDRVLLLGAVDAASARRAIDRSKVGELARGFRNLPTVDTGGLADVVAKLSAWMASEPRVAEVDLNPVILGTAGPTIVDARIVLS
jgi:acyl-CoA synthetase (NDP forming)